MTNAELIREAKKARERAYVPYSHHSVGAALVTKSGKIYHGCNIENAAYGPTNCAERTAFFKAISEGKRKFKKIAIAGGKEELISCYPCGVCRQVMAEFCDLNEFEIICGTSRSGLEIYKLKELLPKAFANENQ